MKADEQRVYTLLAVLVALSSALLQSQARYAMVVFPIYMVLATWGRRAKVDQLIRAIFLVLFRLMTAEARSQRSEVRSHPRELRVSGLCLL